MNKVKINIVRKVVKFTTPKTAEKFSNLKQYNNTEMSNIDKSDEQIDTRKEIAKSLNWSTGKTAISGELPHDAAMYIINHKINIKE